MLLAPMSYPRVGAPERFSHNINASLASDHVHELPSRLLQTCHDCHACNLDSQVDHKDVVDIKNLGYKMW